MVYLVREDIYKSICDLMGIEKSTSHRTEKVRKLVQVQKEKGGYYQAYRWVKIMDGKAARIDKKYNSVDAAVKIQYNQKHIVSKDFRDLTQEEVKDFVNRAKNEYYYYDRMGVHIAYGNEKSKDKEKFNKELADCKVLVDAGHEVYWLPESYAYNEIEFQNKKHGDTITDDIPLEMKDTPKNIKGNYKEARDQAIDIFIRVTGSITTGYAMDSIDKYIRALRKDKKSDKSKDFTGKLYLYFEKYKQLRLIEFDKSGKWKETKAQKK